MLRRKDMREYIKGCILLCALCLGSMTAQAAEDDIIEFQGDHLNHVTTQLPYAMTVAAVSFVTYIVAGFVQNAAVSLLVGAVLTVAALFVLRRAAAKGESEAAV